MTTPVTFELAKLLKEKGIKIDTEEIIFYRDEVNNIKEHQIKNRDVLYNYTGFGNYTPDENEYQTYTIAEVIMWLYEKHGIWIVSEMISKVYEHSPEFYGRIRYFENEFIKQENTRHFNSPTEAYLAAIEYTLNNLI